MLGISRHAAGEPRRSIDRGGEFNLHGDMVPSDVSVVRVDSLQEIARITTCTMPHGSRMNSTGTRHYSVCMMDDQLVEIDLDGLQVARHFLLTRGLEQGMTGTPPTHCRGAITVRSRVRTPDMT